MPTFVSDIKACDCVLGGKKIQGFQDGTSITFGRVEAKAWNTTTGGDGLSERARNNNENYYATFVLKIGSPSNDDLNAILLAYNLGNPNGDVKTFTYSDKYGNFKLSSSAAWIEEIPEHTRSKDGGTANTWKIFLSDPQVEIRGSQAVKAV